MDRKVNKRRPEDDVHSSKFFPLLDDFLEYLNVGASDFAGPRKVLVSLEFLRCLIGIAAGELAFDKAFYQDRYPDLRNAHEAALIKDLKVHFVTNGFFERRQGSLRQSAPVDEKWYLDEYPDVARAVTDGDVASATHHYLGTGRREGRRPASDLSEEMLALIRAMHRSQSGE